MIEEFTDEYHTPYRKKIVQKLHLTVFYVSICPYQLSMFSNKCLLAFVSAFPLHKEYWNKCLTNTFFYQKPLLNTDIYQKLNIV